jgi:hypothetical protein
MPECRSVKQTQNNWIGGSNICRYSKARIFKKKEKGAEAA